MVSGRVTFEQLGEKRNKRTCKVAWSIDGDRKSIKVEYNSESGQWSTIGTISVDSLEFVNHSFNEQGRWIILRYENEGSEYQLVVEGPKSMKGHTYYDIRIEHLESATMLVDKTRVQDMPEFEYAEGV